MPEFSAFLSSVAARPQAAEKAPAKATPPAAESGRAQADFKSSMQSVQKEKPAAKPAEDPKASSKAPGPAQAKSKLEASDDPEAKEGAPIDSGLPPEIAVSDAAILVVPTPVAPAATGAVALTGQMMTPEAPGGEALAAPLAAGPELLEPIAMAEGGTPVAPIEGSEAKGTPVDPHAPPFLAGTAVNAVAVNSVAGKTPAEITQATVIAAEAGVTAPADGKILTPQPVTAKTEGVSPAADLSGLRSQKLDAAPGAATTTESFDMDALVESFAGAESDRPASGEANALSRQPPSALPTGAGVLSGKVSVPVNVPFGSEQWQNAVGERAVLLVRQNIQSAELQLDPPELGPLQVRIQLNHDQAVVNFTSANGQVRDALDQTMGRLKEMLQEQGFSQVQTGVSDHPDRHARQQRQASQGTPEGVMVDGADATSAAQTLQLDVRSGIDYFA